VRDRIRGGESGASEHRSSTKTLFYNFQIDECLRSLESEVFMESDFLVEDSSGFDVSNRFDRMRNESGVWRFGGAERTQ